MKSKTYIQLYPQFSIADDISSYSFRISDDKMKMVLVRSPLLPGWSSTHVGTVAASLKDTENDVTINIGKKKITLDYSDLNSLSILIKLYEHHQNQTYKLLEARELGDGEDE